MIVSILQTGTKWCFVVVLFLTQRHGGTKNVILSVPLCLRVKNIHFVAIYSIPINAAEFFVNIVKIVEIRKYCLKIWLLRSELLLLSLNFSII